MTILAILLALSISSKVLTSVVSKTFPSTILLNFITPTQSGFFSIVIYLQYKNTKQPFPSCISIQLTWYTHGL